MQIIRVIKRPVSQIVDEISKISIKSVDEPSIPDQQHMPPKNPIIRFIVPKKCYIDPTNQTFIINNHKLMYKLCKLIENDKGMDAIMELFKAKHQDPKHPQYRNVRYANLSIEFFKRGNWDPQPATIGAEMIVCHLASDIMEWVDDHEHDLNINAFKIRRWYHALDMRYEEYIEYVLMRLRKDALLTQSS